ncbi:MAG: hypothetical protein Fur0041_17750 [Bacteroidia bacterium]
MLTFKEMRPALMKSLLSFLKNYLFMLMLLISASADLFSRQYNFREYNVANGLPHSQITSIYQDKSGFLWFGSEGGLCRYDGKEFDIFNRDNGFPSKTVSAVTESADGIVAATEDGLVVFSQGKFSVYKPLAADPFAKVNAMFSGPGGQIILCTDNGLFEFSKKKISRIKTGTPLDHLQVKTGYTDSKKRIWLGTDRNGLFQLEFSYNQYSSVNFTDQDKLAAARVRGITETISGDIWIATSGNGLYSFDGAAFTSLKLPENNASDYLTCISKDHNGDIWIGTWGQGVIQYRQSVFYSFNQTNGLSDDVITCIYPDNQNNIWFGTFSSGLIQYQGDVFTSLKKKDGLPDENIRGVVQDEEGNMWFATLNGVARYDGIDMTYWNQSNGASGNRAAAICTDGKRVFAGFLNGSVTVFADQKVMAYKPDSALEVGEIISILYTQDGSLWLGSATNGLFRFANGAFEKVNTGNVLQRNAIWSLHEDKRGTLWIGTNNGIYKMENGNAVRPVSKSKNPFPAEAIYDIESDDQYIYFASKNSGLWRLGYEASGPQVLNTREGLASDFTEGLLLLPGNQMMVMTIQGFDLIKFHPDGQSISHYYYKDGIGTSNFSPGAICKSKDGSIWFGSRDGVIIFSPESDHRNMFVTNVAIKEVLLFNQTTDWNQFVDSISSNGLPFEPVLSYDQNNISFKIASVYYGTGKTITYSYKLSGQDTGWLLLREGNLITYSNLAPGKYKLEIKASGINGISSKITSFTFTVLPPFWQTWWFFVAILIVITVITYLLVFLYRRFRSDFIKQHRSFYDYQLVTARFIMILGGILYPFSGWLLTLFENNVTINHALQIIIGLLMISGGLLTFTIKFFRKYAQAISHAFFGLLMLQIVYEVYVNNLNPPLVVMMMVVLGASGFVFDNIRDISVFSFSVIITISVLVGLAPESSQYNKWLMLLAVLIVLIISFLSVFSRLNLFNRLIFADTTLNNSRSLVIAADAKGKIIFASKSFKYILGYDEEDLLGDGWWKLRSENQRENEKIREKIQNVRGTANAYVVPIRARDGAEHWIQWVDTEIQEGIKIGVGLDVTDRHEIEERYRYIVEAATDIIYTVDYRGHFTFLNDVAFKLTGFSADELIGKHFTDLVRPDWMKEVRDFYANQFRKKLTSTYLEFPIVAADGKTIWIGQTVRVLFDEIRPSLIRGFQAIARDITDKKHYEEELEKLSLVASETINGVLICDPDGKIEWVNEGFTRITGYSLDEVQGRLPGDILAGDRTDRNAISEVRNIAGNLEGFHKEFLVYHKEGYEIWIDVVNTPIVDENGNPLKQIEIFTDISEKKRYEVQLNRYSARLETLNMAKQELLRSQNITEVAQNVLSSLAARLPYLKRTSIALFDDHFKTAEILFVKKENTEGLLKTIVPVDAFRSLPLLQKNRHLLIHDLRSEQNLSESDRENLESGILSYLATPLFTQGKLIGSINIGSGEANSISEDDIEMVREVADAIAATVQQIRYLEIIEQKNEDISASILYARRIQDAILPPEEILREHFGEMFILYKPKDILSGDFYWAEKRGKYTYLAVVDSTGHGVPGALLSLMGHNLLNQAVHERELTKPAAILDYLNAGIQHTLNQYKKSGELRDGMDISLCVFEEGSNVLYFAGAINPMYIIRNGMLIQSKGNRFSIGSYFDNKMRPFTNQETELQSGDVIYLFTDGYADQFGGEDDRKLSQRRFRELLMDIHDKPLQDQKAFLDHQLEEWMKGGRQTDDICVIGIKIR